MKKYLILILVLIILSGCAKKTVLRDMEISETTIYEESIKNYEDGRWGKAIEGFQSYIFSYPASSKTEKAQYYLADAYYMDNNYTQAIIEFNYFIKNYKAYSLREQSFFKLADSYFKLTPTYQHDQTLTVNAISVIEDFKLEFPETEMIQKVDSLHRILLSRLEEKKLHTANFYLKKKNSTAAEIYLEDIIPENLLPEYRDFYLYKYGITLNNLKKYEQAEQLLTLIPESSTYYSKAKKIITNIKIK